MMSNIRNSLIVSPFSYVEEQVKKWVSTNGDKFEDFFTCTTHLPKDKWTQNYVFLKKTDGSLVKINGSDKLIKQNDGTYKLIRYSVIKKLIKLGHQAPKGCRSIRFNSVEIDGDFHYCTSHNFVYNVEVEKEKLYNAQPCYYTDKRYLAGRHNYYKNTKLWWTRFQSFTLKSFIRLIRNCKNIPTGTIVNIRKSYYFPKKDVDTSYKFKIRKENKLELDYQINLPEYFDNFNTCEFSKNLTDALRANGFIVQVFSKNPNYISSMIATATTYVGQKAEETNEEGEIAIAYGYGKKIGYSSKNDSYLGYSDGKENILYDYFGKFNKWSQCHLIDKNTSINEIVEILKQKKEKEIDA